MRTILHGALASLAVLTLAACGGGDDGGKAGTADAKPSDATLAATLNGDGDLDTLESVVTNSGLASVLEGVGPYTVLAPSDAAFEAGGGAAGFTGETQKAEAAALLRAHIVPGALTRKDIAAAIERAGQDGVEMRTMADGLLTFSKDGEAIVVTTPDGARARLTGDEELARNGVIQPLDGLLVKPVAAAPAA
jgi:uncharacterized surface protein with fasciclin (FAS1) repeats